MATLRLNNTEVVSVSLRELLHITEEKIEGYTATGASDRFFTLTQDPFDVNDVTASVNGVFYTLNVDYKINVLAGPTYQFEWITPPPSYTLSNGDIIQLEYMFATKPVPGAGLTGLTSADVTAYYKKNIFGAGAIALPLTGTNFIEVDAFNMPGVYQVKLTATELDTAGPFTLSLTPVIPDTFYDTTFEATVVATAGGSFLTEILTSGSTVDQTLTNLDTTWGPGAGNTAKFYSRLTKDIGTLPQNGGVTLPISLYNIDGSDGTGYDASVDSVVLYVSKAGGTFTPTTLTAGEFIPLVGEYYALSLPSTYFDTLGSIHLLLIINGDDTSTSLKGEVIVPLLKQQVGTTGLSLENVVEFMYHVQGGKWKINTAHPSGNPVLELYQSDNSTLVAEFDLLDAAGVPTSVNPFQRFRRP